MAERTDFIQTGSTRVASIQLGDNESSPWHRHTEVLERIVCLSGVIEVQCQNPVGCKVLDPGDMAEIAPQRPHRLVNPRSLASAYLLIQSGNYDFVIDDE